MSLTDVDIDTIETLRLEGWGGRRIADYLAVSYGKVRYYLETHPLAETNGGYRHVVIVPDTQYPYINEPAEAAVQEYISRTQPDEVLFLGDFMDFYSLGTFRKKVPPKDRIWLPDEVELGRAKVAEWSALSPNANYKLIAGNHEERLERYLEDNGGELYGIDVLTFDRLLELDKWGWEYINPYGAGVWVGGEGGLWATHGDLARKWSGASPRGHVMEKYGHSVIHGHTHRLGSFYHTNAVGTMVGLEAGCLCDPETTPRATAVVDWQLGFAVAWVSPSGPRFHCDLIAITDGGFVYGGEKYGA